MDVCAVMEFVAIIGDPGSGKTNMMVRYLFNEYQSGTPIISNLRSLKFPQTYMGFNDLIEAAKRDDPRLNGAYVGTDELGLGADSYEFFSNKNKGLTDLNAQRRKFHLRWIYSVQRFSMISKRLRLLTDGFVSMTDMDKQNMRRPDGSFVKFHREVCMGIFRADFFDRDMRLVKSKPFNGRKYWKYYDTDEKISRDRKILVPDDGEDEDY